jgi:pimeloyl-ACP methyl ester carboxylesterase
MIDFEMIPTNNIKLHTALSGPADGKPVILLHGFPEFWYCWREQIPALAEAGFRVLAPDQRGYNLSDRPRGIRAYGMDSLADDIAGLIDQAAGGSACVVGHDWGGMVAWWLAMKHPDKVRRLAILNVPHPTVMRTYMSRTLSQLRKSWYIFYFQLPLLPELSLGLGNWAGLFRVMRNTANPGSFDDADLARYRDAWNQPGAMRAMINYYRALARVTNQRIPGGLRVHVPTLLIWGKQDAFLNHKMAELSRSRCDEIRVEMIEDATHWVQVDAAERVNQLLMEFFQ